MLSRDVRDTIHIALAEADTALQRLRHDPAAHQAIEQAADAIEGCLGVGAKVLCIGNGGSMCDAMHFAAELTGRYRANRPGLPAIACSDPAHLTCVANDFGFDAVFERWVQSVARDHDLLLAISTSGESANVIKAVEFARPWLRVVALTGKPECTVGNLADIHICTPGGTGWADRTQELHIKVLHILAELATRDRSPSK